MYCCQLTFITIALWGFWQDEKSPANLIENPFYMMRHFLLTLSRFSLFFISQFAYDVSRYVWLPLNFFYLELSFLDVPVIFLRANLRWFWPLFLQIFFLPLCSSSLSGTAIMCLLVYLMTTHKCLRLCLVFFHSVSKTGSSQLTHFQACWLFLPPVYICCWALFEFFNFNYCIFQLQNFYLVFL